MNPLNNTKPAGIRPYTAGENLTDMEGRFAVFSGARELSLPTGAANLALMLIVLGAAAALEVQAQSLIDGGQVRGRINGTGSAGDILVIDVTSGNEGKVKVLPATAGVYFSVGTLAEDAVDEQLALIEPLPRLITVAGTAVTAVTLTATSGSLPTANGAVTIANAATPTVAELQECVVELNAKITALAAALTTAGITA